MATANAGPLHSNVVPSEVGWQFVPQYYTYMNKQPNRLHCFYTKNSTFIHGTEGEDIKPCFGQQEIHNKILGIGFNDCKVFIHSVDAQSSANGGIVIQVIGEMSNNNEAWRKFAQTFFLAEQPNGYFVLNDIFRFLKEETVETEDAEGEHAHEPPTVDAPAPPAAESAVAEPVAVEEPAATVEPVPEPPAETVKINGFHVEEPAPVVVETAPVEPEPVPEPARQPTPSPVVLQQASPPKTPEPVQQQPSPAASPAAKPPTPAPVVQSPPPQPAPPPVPKTWANLAAANLNKWGSTVAQEAKGVSAAAAPSISPSHSGTTTPLRDGQHTPNRGPRDRDGQSAAYQAAMSITTPQCFIKGVIDGISDPALRNVLSSRFGPIKEVEIVRNKACAFLEFANLDSAKRAIVASLPVHLGGEGGILVPMVDGGDARINVETKKERGERGPSRPRGGPPGGDTRGGYRGRGGGTGERGRGRGGPPSTSK